MNTTMSTLDKCFERNSGIIGLRVVATLGGENRRDCPKEGTPKTEDCTAQQAGSVILK